MPKVFSSASLSFDRAPDDSELTGLLGDPDCGPIKHVETDGIITVSPRLVPMKFVVPWMLFVGIVITCMIIFMPLIENKKPDLSPLALGLMSVLWLGAIPGVLGLLFLLNSAFAKKGDYFKVDTTRRTLELCQPGLTFKFDQIAAVIELSRWYRRCGGILEYTLQTSVLIRKPDGQFDLFPVLREIDVPVFGKAKWADRLAAIFQSPVRRINLTRSESRQLNDC
jgi:hypothetical protein